MKKKDSNEFSISYSATKRLFASLKKCQEALDEKQKTNT